MKYHTIDFNGKEINFRLKSEDAVKLEEKTGVKLLDYIQDYSMKTIINLIRYMRKGEDSNFSEKDALILFDELADNDWALEDIMKNIIYPTCQVSGLLTKGDLMKIYEKMENHQEATPQTNQ